MAVKAVVSIQSVQPYSATPTFRVRIEINIISGEEHEQGVLLDVDPSDGPESIHAALRNYARNHAETEWEVDFDPGDVVAIMRGLPPDMLPAE